MKKLNIGSLTEDKVFINLLDKEIERHLKEYYQDDRTTNTRGSTDLKKTRQQFKSLSFLKKNIVVVKDHRRIVYKTHHDKYQSMEMCKGQFSDLLYSERVTQRSDRLINIKTQQTQRSEMKTATDELLIFKPLNIPKANRLEDIQSRITQEYLQKEHTRLKLAKEQVVKNEILLEQLSEELRIINSNVDFIGQIKNIEQQIYKNQLNYSNYLKVTYDLEEYLRTIQSKYFGQHKQFFNFIEEFKDELKNILTNYHSLMQLQKFQKQN